MDILSKKDLLKEIIEDVEKEVTDEEVLRIILERKMTAEPKEEKYSFGQKAADRVAKIAGSWGFIIVFVCVLAIWMLVNTSIGKNSFDPYPFILLNLVLSCLAAIQAPLILMSQNRQNEKDRRRAESDYRVNLKTEIIIRELYDKLDVLVESQISPSDAEEQG